MQKRGDSPLKKAYNDSVVKLKIPRKGGVGYDGHNVRVNSFIAINNRNKKEVIRVDTITKKEASTVLPFSEYDGNVRYVLSISISPRFFNSFFTKKRQRFQFWKTSVYYQKISYNKTHKNILGRN